MSDDVLLLVSNDNDSVADKIKKLIFFLHLFSMELLFTHQISGRQHEKVAFFLHLFSMGLLFTHQISAVCHLIEHFNWNLCGSETHLNLSFILD